MTGPPFITSKGERQTTELRKVCVAWEMSYQHMLVNPKTIWSGYFFLLNFYGWRRGKSGHSSSLFIFILFNNLIYLNTTK